MRILLAICLFFLLYPKSHASTFDPKFYRELSIRVRSSVAFKIPAPTRKPIELSYILEFAEPMWESPQYSDYRVDPDSHKFIRHFWDKIFLKDGSQLTYDGVAIPLTCIYVDGQDNRYFEKTGPLAPDFILRVYLVANDYSCTGPVNPGWPETTSRKENWSTYVYYEVRDPTIMLPMEPILRFNWLEQPIMVQDQGRLY